MNSEIVLEARGVQKSFKKGKLVIPVLRGVDLAIKRGETVAIVGASGAGKSTLLHILGTLEAPSGGHVLFQGKNISSQSEERRCEFRNRHIGFIFQFHYLLPEFSALENVMMPGLIAGRHEHQLKAEALALLEEVGLSHRVHHKPGELSGGESQRVAVARALMMKPDVILGDELTGNLDSQNSEMLLSMLLSINQRHGVSVVVVTHDLKLAASMGRTITMQDGKLV
ncbi:MAG TPA: ABC transporter ATP-binding protein [Oligoflexia bacterium]|nr:ABC transporter ATP-binding protein [Oligoflexia bacterium]